MSDIFDKPIELQKYASDYLGVGWHEVSPSEFKTNSDNPERPFVEVMFRDKNGSTIRKNFYLTPKAMWVWIKFIKCFGVKETETISVRDAISRIRGKKIRINVIENANDNGKIYKNVEDYEAVQGEMPDMPYEEFKDDNPGYTNSSAQEPPQQDYRDDPF